MDKKKIQVPFEVDLRIDRNIGTGPTKYYADYDIRENGDGAILGRLTGESYKSIDDAIQVLKRKLPEKAKYGILNDFLHYQILMKCKDGTVLIGQFAHCRFQYSICHADGARGGSCSGYYSFDELCEGMREHAKGSYEGVIQETQF